MANLNYSGIAVLLGENVKLVGVKFSGSKQYAYKTTIDFELGDFAVVVAQGFYKVVSVTQTTDLQVEDDVDYKWIVDKVDITSYTENIAKELEMCARLRELDNRNKQVQLLEALGLNPDKLKLPRFK